LIAQSELREEIKYLEYELGEAKPYKERFEALEKAQPPEYEKLLITLKKQVSTFKEDALRAKNDLAKSKQMIDLYQAYVEGKSNKDGLEDSLEKLKGQQVNFFNVKLKKIKVQTVIKKAGPGSPE
jgi:hypothetical protein